MAEYNINKGIGQSVEFKGLKAQYLFIFAGGLLAIFVLFVILFLAGVNQWVCIGTCLAACVADLRPQPTLRGVRTDEADGKEKQAPFPHQPQKAIPDH